MNQTDYEHPNFYPTCYFENAVFFVEFSEYRVQKNFVHEIQKIYTWFNRWRIERAVVTSRKSEDLSILTFSGKNNILGKNLLLI